MAAVLEEGSDAERFRNALSRSQVFRPAGPFVQQPDAVVFGSHPDPSVAVLGEIQDLVFPVSGHLLEAGRPRGEPVEAAPAAGQDRAVGGPDEAGQAVVREVDPRNHALAARIKAVKAVAVGRNPEFVALHEDGLDIVVGPVQVKGGERIRSGVKAVQPAVLRAHPDGSGRVGRDRPDNPALHGSGAVARIKKVVGALAVLPQVEPPVEGSDPDIAFLIRKQVHGIAGGKGHPVPVRAHDMPGEPFSLHVDPDSRLGADPILPGAALQQAEHPPAAGFAAVEDAFLPVVLRVDDEHILVVVHGQEAAAGNPADQPDGSGPLFPETVRPALITVQFPFRRSEPGCPERIDSQGHRPEIVRLGIGYQFPRAFIILVRAREKEPDASVGIRHDLPRRVALLDADAGRFAGVRIVIAVSAGGGEPDKAVGVHAEGGRPVVHDSLGIRPSHMGEIVAVIPADAVAGSDPDIPEPVLGGAIDRIARQAVADLEMVEAIVVGGRVEGQGGKYK